MRSISAAIILILAPVVLAGTAFAKKEPKGYPEEGKIIATAVNEVPFTTYQQTGGPNGATIPVRSIRRSRTYTVQTDTKTYELDCGKHPAMFSRTPGECGGDKKLQIGDAIHFRLEKGWAYIPVTEANGGAVEQKLRVLNEELKRETEPAPPAPPAPPVKTGEKPPSEH
jgi:hypothetical protein